WGAPTEFKFRGEMVPDEQVPDWKSEMVRAALNQDDLYVQMAFTRVIDEKGLAARPVDFAEEFRETKFSLWHSHQACRRALRRGVELPLTSSPEYNLHGEDIGFQIDADFIGVMCPGMPASAAESTNRVAQIFAWG